MVRPEGEGRGGAGGGWARAPGEGAGPRCPANERGAGVARVYLWRSEKLHELRGLRAQALTLSSFRFIFYVFSCPAVFIKIES